MYGEEPMNLLWPQVVSVESLLKLDASSCCFKIEKSVLRELQRAYCTSLASSCSSVADLAKVASPRCKRIIQLARIAFVEFVFHS
jgi:hypothetical protein